MPPSGRNASVIVVVALIVLPLLARADSLFVADYFAGTITKLALDGTRTTFGSAGAPGTFGLACDSAGHLYVGTVGGPIVKFDSSGNQSVFSTALNDVGDLAVDSAGNLYALNDGNVKVGVTEFSTTGTTLRTIGLGDSNHNPRGLAVDSSGNIFVGLPQNGTNTIQKITPAGSASVFASLVAPVQGLAFDPGGNLYATTGSSIFKYTPSGTRTVFVGFGLTTPQGIACDGAGNLYVIVGGGNSTIEKFTPAGVGTTFATVTSAEDIAIALSGTTASDTPALPPIGLILLATALLIMGSATVRGSTARAKS